MNCDQIECIDRYTGELLRIFHSVRDQREAHARCRRVLEDMSGDRFLLTAVLRKNLDRPGILNQKHYLLVSFEIESSPAYDLVANCWIPLRGREPSTSTKAIHHHGEMILTTVTAFGPGYEHWTFSRPEKIDPDRELYSMALLERGPHPTHHVAFVDCYNPHVAMYPASLSITFALWSNNLATTWKEKVQPIPAVKRNGEGLGLTNTKAPDDEQVECSEFYPTEDGFKGVRDRFKWWGLNSDYLYNLFHILQETNNEELASELSCHLDGGSSLENPQLLGRLLEDLRAGRPIEGRLSEGHFELPYASFSARDIERALSRRRVEQNEAYKGTTIIR